MTEPAVWWRAVCSSSRSAWCWRASGSESWNSRSRSALVATACAAAAALASAQPPGRLATTIDTVRESPVFFHGKQVALLGTPIETRGMTRLEPPSAAGDVTPTPPGQGDLAGRPIFVFWRERPSGPGGEVRGEIWDVGRLTEGDPRFQAQDLRALVDAVNDGRWPGRDQMFVLVNAIAIEANLPVAPTLRAIGLAPIRYENKGVTLSGRFRGRNLYGDVPLPPPEPGKWDFVLQSADAAVWVTGLRPRGRDFELDPAARVDTGRWVEVTGTVRRDGARGWIEATAIALSSPEAAATNDAPSAPAAPEPPPTVIFSAPLPDDADFSPSGVVRVQFSREMTPASFKGRVRVAYLASAAGAPLALPLYSAVYDPGNRGVEITFAKPLERFQTVYVELLDGITATDGQPLAPWSLTFSTGGK